MQSKESPPSSKTENLISYRKKWVVAGPGGFEPPYLGPKPSRIPSYLTGPGRGLWGVF